MKPEPALFAVLPVLVLAFVLISGKYFSTDINFSANLFESFSNQSRNVISENQENIVSQLYPNVKKFFTFNGFYNYTPGMPYKPMDVGVPPNRSDVCYPFGNLVTMNAGGRFGNLVFRYASLLAAQNCLGYPAALTQDLHNKLDIVFKGLTIPIVPHECWKQLRKWQDKYWCRAGKDEEAKAKNPGSPFTRVMVSDPAMVWHDVLPYMDELKTVHFQFRDQITSNVALVKNRIRNQNFRTVPIKEMKFIGVHIRREDKIAIMNHQCEVFVDLDVSWFTHAFELIIQTMNITQKQTAFLIATTDPQWFRDMLTNTEEKQKINFTRKYDIAKFKKNIFLLDDFYHNPENNKDLLWLEPQYFDFSVLSHCDGSIMTWGTYGDWSSQFANGPTLIATRYCKERGKNRWGPSPGHGSKNYSRINVPVAEIVLGEEKMKSYNKNYSKKI